MNETVVAGALVFGMGQLTVVVAYYAGRAWEEWCFQRRLKKNEERRRTAAIWGEEFESLAHHHEEP